MSIISKNKNAFVDSSISPHFSKSRYMPYHYKIQKHINKYNQDYYFVDRDNSKGGIETGINQLKANSDYSGRCDLKKDGN